MTTIWLVSPWRRAFRETFFLPSSVTGPVECWAFSRFISMRFSVDIFFLLVFYSRGFGEGWADENGRWLRRGEFLSLKSDVMWCASRRRFENRRGTRGRVRHEDVPGGLR